jgi:hypothetical protein
LSLFFDMIFFTFPIVIASRGQGVNYRKLDKIILRRSICITND